MATGHWAPTARQSKHEEEIGAASCAMGDSRGGAGGRRNRAGPRAPTMRWPKRRGEI
jgi:hypothetical protein